MSDDLRLIWIDLEMTGLDPDHDKILEIATIVTDSALNILAEGPVFAIFQPEACLQGMDSWNQKHHLESGLLDRVRASVVTEKEAESKTLEFLSLWVKAKISPMCGNSICQDRRFLYRYMLQLETFFHYRNLDVSTIKELARRWAPDIAKKVVKKNVHLALDDIKESIEELSTYRHHFFRL